MSPPRFHTIPRRRWAVGGMLTAAALALAACQPIGEADGNGDPDGSPAGTGDPGDGDTTQLSIATGGTGGVYYPLGGGFATVIRENISGYDATVQETNASVDNMLLIQSGGADMALVLGDTAADAVEGRADFEGDPVEACTLGDLYSNFTQILTSADSGITSIEDLSGASVSLGSPGSGTEVIALRILEVAGIDPDADIERQQLGVAETVEALRDGTIDAGFWSGGLPTGALIDYATTGEMALIPHAEYEADLQAAYGDFYVAGDVPAGTYEGQDEAVPSIIVPNVLVVNSAMDEELQRQITEAIFENREQLAEVQAAAEELDPVTAGDVAFMDVCPGAQSYFDEQG
ncbi:MAG: TAXI family TRAP transporter solute-binding subunit [Candidatus Limnocylindria bacterium]